MNEVSDIEIYTLLSDIMGMCIAEQAMGYRLDSNKIGSMIYETLGMNAEELNEMIRRHIKRKEDAVKRENCDHDWEYYDREGYKICTYEKCNKKQLYSDDEKHDAKLNLTLSDSSGCI